MKLKIAEWHSLMGPPREARRVDYAGQRFGSYVVHSFVGRKRGSKGNALWLCHCDCGNVRVVAACYLVNGNQRSCGCRSWRPKAPPKSQALPPAKPQLEVICLVCANTFRTARRQFYCSTHCANYAKKQRDANRIRRRDLTAEQRARKVETARWSRLKDRGRIRERQRERKAKLTAALAVARELGLITTDNKLNLEAINVAP